MRNFAAVAFAVTLASLSAAKADVPGPDWMPMEQNYKVSWATRRLLKLKADDGRWEGEGIKNGQKFEFHADPKTGVIVREKPDH